jgi:hypothetical protein
MPVAVDTAHLPRRRPPSRAHEGCDAKIKENHDENYRGHKASMIGTMIPTGAGSPNHWSKDNYREQKKDAGDFKPNNAADSTERAQETADALGDTVTGLGCGARRGCNGQPRILDRSRPTRLRGTGYPLAGNLSRNSDSDSHSPANSLWLHCYDANSVPLFSACAQLPIVFFRHRK